MVSPFPFLIFSPLAPSGGVGKKCQQYLGSRAKARAADRKQAFTSLSTASSRILWKTLAWGQVYHKMLYSSLEVGGRGGGSRGFLFLEKIFFFFFLDDLPGMLAGDMYYYRWLLAFAAHGRGAWLKT